jgi:hypothetical protein
MRDHEPDDDLDDPLFDEQDDVDEDDEALLDEEFPLGDGVADTAGVVACPYCGEENELSLDPGGGTFQEYVEDCHVCCQPWRVYVTYHPDGSADVSLQTADGE